MADEIVYADLRHPGNGFSPAEKHHGPALCPQWHGVLLKVSVLGHLVLLVVVVVLSVQACAGCRLCPQDWQLHGEKCYRLSKEKGNWSQGKKGCENQESQLVVLCDKKEKEYIKNITGGGTQPVWIGLSFRKKWTWVDNTPLNTKMFDPLQEVAEGCITLKDKVVEVDTCDTEHEWVCQKEPFQLSPSLAGDGEKCDASV
ncbi:PREDICTED: C-type lectin domain family 2 member B-like [Nipponia nippon]|uniref:C-type lectin domain family 2 member B-like n=1 Tax=Nipponia nippon TaxID=128390 RepID=UPI000511350C|nr:PREDICTED: C-type lectin domain family 2 member B-like [Nipponia nippon]